MPLGHEAQPAARKITHRLLSRRGVDGIVIEDRKVGRHTLGEVPTIGDSEQIGRLRRYALDCVLQAEKLLVARPVPSRYIG